MNMQKIKMNSYYSIINYSSSGNFYKKRFLTYFGMLHPLLWSLNRVSTRNALKYLNSSVTAEFCRIILSSKVSFFVIMIFNTDDVVMIYR